MQKQDGTHKRSNSNDFTDQQEMVAPLLQEVQEGYKDEDHLHEDYLHSKTDKAEIA